MGQTSSAKGYVARFNQHIQEANHNTKHVSILHRSIRKYGKEAFKVKRILHDIEEDRIDFLECLWIQKLNTFYLNGKGYNMTAGGQGVHNYRHTETTKAKISKSNSGRIFSSERTQKILETKKLRGSQVNRQNKQWISNMSKAAKKRFENSPGTFTGKHHTEETRKRLSDLHSIPVVAYEKNSLQEFKRFSSAQEASTYLNNKGITSNKSAFCRILTVCHGRGKSAYGYIWKFAKDVTTIPEGSRKEDELPSEAHIIEEIV